MKPILTTVLLLFVGASVFVVIANRLTKPKEPAPAANVPGNAGTPGTVETAPTTSDENAPVAVEVVMWHGAQRCASCNWIEAQALAVLEDEEFQGAEVLPRITWREANYSKDDEAEASRFGVGSAGIVLRRLRGGAEEGFVNLIPQCWDLAHVRDDAGLRTFLREALRRSLGMQTNG